MRSFFPHVWALVLVVLWVGCGPVAPRTDAASSADVVDVSAPSFAVPPFKVVTWNLHNFSIWGTSETRTEAIAREIQLLEADLIAVQELKVKEDTDITAPQAWDRLLGLLPHYDGIHVPWSDFDTTVGLIYRKDVVTIHSHEVLFPEDWYAFPRSPLRVSLTVTRQGVPISFDVIVLHLKAFGDSADRRRDAMDKLYAYCEAEALTSVVILGDLNDDPHDAPTDNVFTGNFLETEPDYVFLTAQLPEDTVTSTGWYQWVDGEKVYGENLDHVIFGGTLHAACERVEMGVAGVEASEFDAYTDALSDHFPVWVSCLPDPNVSP